MFTFWTLEFPRCTQRTMRGQCAHNHRHYGSCLTLDGFRWWPAPEDRLEPLPISEFARLHGISWPELEEVK